jgi:DNA-binding response OmpR family regulator
MRVLIVEDELKMASLLRRGLVKRGTQLTGGTDVWLALTAER